MVASVYEGRLQAHYRESSDGAVLCGLLESLLDCGEEVLRNRAAEHLLAEHQLVAVVGLELYLYVSVLTVSAGLLLVFALDGHRLADSFTVRDLRLGHLDLHAELGFQLCRRDIKVLVAQTAYHALVGLVVVDVFQRGILLQKSADSAGELALVAASCEVNGAEVACLRELRRRKRCRLLRERTGCRLWMLPVW